MTPIQDRRIVHCEKPSLSEFGEAFISLRFLTGGGVRGAPGVCLVELDSGLPSVNWPGQNGLSGGNRERGREQELPGVSVPLLQQGFHTCERASASPRGLVKHGFHIQQLRAGPRSFAFLTSSLEMLMLDRT